MRDLLRRVIERTAGSFGFLLAPKWRVAHLAEEQHLARLFELLQIDCVFDVGANVGQHAEKLRKYVNFKGTILSFEPNPMAYSSLATKAEKDPSWHTESFALGAQAGTMAFNAYSRSDMSSFRTLSDKEFEKSGIDKTTINVPVRTLNDYYFEAKARFNFKRPFLKLDTQGFDKEVLLGSESVISEFLGLQSEIAFDLLYEGAPDFAESVRYYLSLGFSVSHIVPIHDVYFPRRPEMDVIMIRNRAGTRSAAPGPAPENQ